jgi:hypothetical protein
MLALLVLNDKNAETSGSANRKSDGVGNGVKLLALL